MGKKSISVSEYNELRGSENATSSRSMTKSDYDNLRNNKVTAVPLSINGKDYGKISANAYNAIRYNNLDVYTPTNDAEKSIIDSYIKDNFKDNEGNALATSLDDYKNKVEQAQAQVEQAQAQTEEKAGFGKWLGSQALAGLATFNKGVAATLDFILPTEFLGKYDYISKMNDYYSNQHDSYQQAAAKTSVSRGKGWKTAGDVISGTVAALPNAILAFMSGGTSLGASGGATLATGASSASSTSAMIGQAVKTMAKNPMYWTSALQTLGTDYEEAKERGANDFVAASTAIITTALNAGIEVGGGIETLPKNLKTGGKNAVFEWVKSSLDEGKEEVLQGITTNAMAKLMYDKNAPLVSLTDDNAVLNPIKSAKEFAMGAAVGGILGGGQIATQSAVNTVNYNRAGKFFKNPDAVQSIIDTGLESPKDSQSYKLAVKANGKKGNLSNYEIGRLYYANVEQIVSEESSNTEDVTNETNTTIEATETGINSDANSNVGTVNTTAPVNSPEAASTTVETEQVNKTDGQTRSKVKAPVAVGDTFHDTNTGTTLTVVNRDENNTVVRVNESGIEKTFTNDVADMITSNPSFEKVDNTSMAETTALTDDETTPLDTATPQNTESSAAAANTAETVTMADGTTAHRVGDFYEVYGAEAGAIAEKLNLTVTPKVIDGVRTPMVGFPAHAFDTYNNRLNSVTSINEQNTPVTDENTPVNEHIDSENVISHTKEFKGMKLVDIQESTLFNGKTLLTGFYELNTDKDFNRKSYKKENFDVLLQSEPWIKSVSGTTYGHYAFTKTESKNYVIAYLPAGRALTSTDSENKARAAIKVLDESKPELPLSVQAYGDDGVRCFGGTQELAAEIKEIIDTATENADKITLPIKSKKDLIAYLKQHKGSKIGVRYNNGAEDIRTIVSASNTSIVTERADGQHGSLSAKSSELSYTEDGFVFTGSNGVKVAYRFIMEDGVTKAPETVIETPESVTKSEKTEEITSDTVSDDAIEIETKMFNDIVDEVENDDTVSGKKGTHYYVSKHTPDIIVEKAETGEQGLNNEPENDTMVSEKVKEDFKVGDIISVNGKQWRVTSTDFTMTFENLDKNDSEATFQHIGGMDSFKDTHDYTVIKESAENVHDGILGRKGENDNSVRKSEPVSETEEKRQIRTADRELGENVTDESGTGIQETETDASTTGQLDSGNRNDRVRESDDSTRDSGTGTVGNDNVDVETSERRTTKSKDFVITKAIAEDIDTSNPSMDDNIKAIETLHAIESSGKAPTKTQQGLLAKFKGWGGLAGSFYGSSKTKLQEFMSEDEIRAAQGTVNDAYFTPTSVIDSIYKALSHIGFEGGNILEPSMGVGNFFGRMPKAVKDSSNLFGVEIDSISGRIAKQLYPSANIEIAPFQDVAYRDGAFDLIIGNVPFGEVKYKYKNQKYLIHDYFFVKAMDKLNDGGILAFLTTKGTLDKLDSTTRTELANQGKLIGAYRLPSNVFSKSAGANVVTDLIIMQKSTDKDGENFVNLSSVPVGADTFSINEYFANHPENIIGELTTRKDWRSGKTELDVRATGSTAEQLVKAIKKLPKNLLSGVQTVGTVNVTENTAKMQTFTVTEKDVVEYVDVSTSEVKQIKGKNAITAKEYIKLKEAYQDLVDTTLSGNSTEVIESKRKALNTVYDGFVKKHGTLEKNKKLLSADNDFYKMSGLEVYDTKTKKTVKSEMFTKDTLGKRKPKKADSVLDALSISIGETGTVDLNRIAGLTGLTEDEAAQQLSDRIVYTPDGEYELNEVYLSGNVREKYEAVKGKKGFEKNAQMLEAVIPEDIPAKNITPQFGSPWIKPDYVADFLTELLNLRYKPTVNYDPTTGTWSVSGNTWGDHTLLTKKYGTAYMDAMSIAAKALNMRRIVVTDKDKKILVGETRAAQQKAEDIKTAFEEWCFKDSDRRKDLVKTFNEKFNSNRNMDFSELAKYLTFDGLSDTFELRDYQKRAVARAVFNGNTLLAHGVGTGKTAEMIAIAMELKRMGIAKKNMMVVPPHKVADFRNDILKMYPSAKVAMLEKGANPTQRQRFYALVASNDFDTVIIPHSSFGMLDVSAETKKAFINNQIYELEEVLTAAQEEKGKIDGRFIRTLEKQKKRLEEKLKFVTESAKDSGNTFEELGVDSLFVDEAHNFKNLPFYSKLSRVAGVSVNQSNNKTRASRAENMFMITDYLNRNDGRIVFGTATPITNSMSEIYNMTRFLRPDILEEAGIQSFDAWASMFGSIVNQAEVDPSGRNMRMKERFSKFKNVSQMIEQFRRMADILKTGDVIQELPEVERIDVINEPNDIQEEFLDIIDNMIDEIRSKGQRAEHNMLEVTTAGQMAAIDLRFVSSYFDGKYTDDELNLPNNRTSQVAQRVYKEYVDSNSTKGTQFVFCDKGVSDDPSKKYNFYVYGDLINKLVNLGIPREEIAIAQEFEDKADLSAKVNTGEIRVLIGSTAVMGEGMNAQQKAVALHHMTVPDRPSDIEQREGRIIRFGNENKNVRIYRYIQERSYDSYQWQMQERKANFINQALSGGTVEELEEMSDFQLSAREAKTIASGNPLLLEKIEIEDKLNKLKSIRSKFNTDKLEMQDRLATLPKRIAQKEKAVSTTTADVKTIKGNATEDFEITLGKTKYTERAKAAEALKKGLAKAPRNGSMLKIGSYRGLDLYYTSSFDKGTHYILKGEGEYSVLGGESASGNITRIINLAEKIGETIETNKQMLENYKTEIETLKKEIDSEFPQTKKLEDLQAKLNEIDTQLGINVDTVDMSEVIVADEVDDDVQSSRDLASDNSAERWTTERVDGNEGKGVNLADIVRSISKKFDIPIATGKVTDSEASGTYKRKAETIRTRIANNLPTISHELGHHLDKDYDFSNMESVDLLKSSMSQEFLEHYEEAEKNSEAVAEFVRVYLKNTNDANRLCPEFYADFISTLSKEDLKSLNEIAASVNEYLSYNISERYDAAITTSKKQEKLSFKEKWQRLYTSWVDAFHPQKEAVDYVEEVTGQTLSGKSNAYVLATNSLNAHTIANYLICEGFRDLDGNIIDAKSFMDGIGMVDSKNVALLDKYLVLRHSLEWIAPTEDDVAPKRVFADDTLENVEEIEKQIAQIETEHPEIKTAAENLYEYQNNVLRHFVIPAGAMSEETLNMLNRKYPSYVPFYRAVGKKSGMAKGTFVNQRSPIMRAKGSGALILSPVESIIRNTEKMVKLALRNQTARVLSSYADTVDGFGQFMEAIPPDMIPHTINITANKESFTDALQQIISSSNDYFAVSDLFEQIFGNEVTDFTPVANANKRIVTVLQDGRPTYYQIHDEALYNAVAELAPQQANGYVKWATKIMQPMKLLITQNNPIFAATNAIRDFGTAYKLSEVNNLAVFAAQYVKALGGIITNNADYKRYKAMGGGHSSELSANIDSIARTLRKVAKKDMGKARRIAYSTFVHPIETVAMLNDAVERVPRFAEFQRTLKAGGDLQEAIFNADDITTNFKRRGSGFGVKIANSTFMFNNAAIQGIDKTFRTLTNRDRKKRYKTLLKWMLFALLQAIIGYIYNKEVDEEGYKNLSSYKKNNFYNFAIGDGKFISLPKPRENALLDSFTERTIEYAFGNEEAFYDFGTYLGGQLIPPMLPDDLKSIEDAAHSWLGGTVLGGVIDIGFNQDFKDSPIEGTYDTYLPSNERYTESTSKAAYALGQTRFARNTDLSPKKIDHLISSYTGILGQINKALFPMNENRKDKSIGLRNKFISDSNYSTDVLNRLYENEEKAEREFNYSGTVDTAIEYEKNAIITSYISGMNRAVKALPEDEQRNGRIYLLKALNNWNYDNTVSQTNMLSSLDSSTISTDVVFDGLPSSTLEWTVNKQKYVYQMTPQEYHKYISDYLTVIENARKQYGCNSVENCEAAKKAAKEYMSKYKQTILKNQYLTKAVAKSE